MSQGSAQTPPVVQTIRQAKRDDAQAIADIANLMIRDTLITFSTDEKTVADVEYAIQDQGHRFLVTEIEGQVAGYATYDCFRGGPGYRFTKEHSIYLSPIAQRRGTGRRLLTRLEDIARDEGILVMVAAISSANPGAAQFHHALGYEHAGLMPGIGHKWGQRLDLILMHKQLIAEPRI